MSNFRDEHTSEESTSLLVGEGEPNPPPCAPVNPTFTHRRRRWCPFACVLVAGWTFSLLVPILIGLSGDYSRSTYPFHFKEGLYYSRAFDCDHIGRSMDRLSQIVDPALFAGQCRQLHFRHQICSSMTTAFPMLPPVSDIPPSILSDVAYNPLLICCLFEARTSTERDTKCSIPSNILEVQEYDEVDAYNTVHYHADIPLYVDPRLRAPTRTTMGKRVINDTTTTLPPLHTKVFPSGMADWTGPHPAYFFHQPEIDEHTRCRMQDWCTDFNTGTFRAIGWVWLAGCIGICLFVAVSRWRKWKGSHS